MFAERDCLINGPFIETNLIFDKTYLKQIRLNVEKFIKSIEYDSTKLYLEIGPSEQYFNCSKNGIVCDTLDIDPTLNCTYTHDLMNELVIDKKYDTVICCEIIEHTKNPFQVVNNLKKILNQNGLLYLSFPFNFRMHNPLPDCFRISEFGIREILKDFNILHLKCIYDESNPYFPIHYTVIAENS
jgi:hypothetical protein